MTTEKKSSTFKKFLQFGIVIFILWGTYKLVVEKPTPSVSEEIVTDSISTPITIDSAKSKVDTTAKIIDSLRKI